MHRIGDVRLLVARFDPRLPMAVIAGVNDAAQPGHVLKQVDLAVLQPVADAVGARLDIDRREQRAEHQFGRGQRQADFVELGAADLRE